MNIYVEFDPVRNHSSPDLNQERLPFRPKGPSWRLSWLRSAAPCALCERSPLPGASDWAHRNIEPYNVVNKLGNVISDHVYRLYPTPDRHWSRLLHEANQETRGVCLAFYRVSIPLQLDAWPLLRLNRDTDIVSLHAEPGNVQGVIAFLHDVVAYDPRSIGIAHLAMGSRSGLKELSDRDLSTMHPRENKVIRAILTSSLRTLYFRVADRFELEWNFMERCRWAGDDDRRVPIAPSVLEPRLSSFDLLPSDPRPLSIDLSENRLVQRPRDGVKQWGTILRNFGVETRPPSMEIQFLLSICDVTWPGALTNAAAEYRP